MFSNQVSVDDIEQARYTRRLPTVQGGTYNPQNKKITVKIPGNGLMLDPNRSYFSFDAQVIPTARLYCGPQPWQYTLGSQSDTTPAQGKYYISIGGICSPLIHALDSINTVLTKLQQHPIIRKYSGNGDSWAASQVVGSGAGFGGAPPGSSGPAITLSTPTLTADGSAQLGTAHITDVINITYTGYLWGVDVEQMNLHPVMIPVIGAGPAASVNLYSIIRQFPSETASATGTLSSFIGGALIPNVSAIPGINTAQYGNRPYYAGFATNRVYNQGTTSIGVAAPTGTIATGIADSAAFPSNIANLFNRITVRVGSTPIADTYNVNLINSTNQIMKKGTSFDAAAGMITQGEGPLYATPDGFNRTQRSMAGARYAMKLDFGPLEHPSIPLDPLGNTNLEVDFYLEDPQRILEISGYALASSTGVALAAGTAITAPAGTPLIYPVIDTSSNYSYQISNVFYVAEYVKLFDPRRDQLLKMLPIVLPFDMSQVTSQQIAAGVSDFDYNFVTRVSNLNSVNFFLRPTAAASQMSWPDKMKNFNRNNLANFYVRVDTQNFSDPIPTTVTSAEGFVELEKLFTASPLDLQNSSVITFKNYPQSILDGVNTAGSTSLNACAAVQIDAGAANTGAPPIPTAVAVQVATPVQLTVAKTSPWMYGQPKYCEEGENRFYFGIRMERSPYRTNILSGVNTAVTSATIILKLQFAPLTAVPMDLIAVSNYDSLWQIGANSSSVNQ